MATAVATIIAKKKMLLARAGKAALAPITHIAFGSGGVQEGKVIEPSAEQQQLNEEIYRKNIDKIVIISDTQVRYCCTLNEDELADCDISEIALVDSEGDLLAIKNFRAKGKDSDFSMTFKIDDIM